MVGTSLQDLSKMGVVHVPPVTDITGDVVTLENKQELEVSAVIYCTGSWLSNEDELCKDLPQSMTLFNFQLITMLWVHQ